MMNQKKQAGVDSSHGGAMSPTDTYEATSQLLSSELGYDWDGYIEETLRPVIERLHDELPRIIQPDMERLRSTLQQAQDELVGPVRQTLTQHVEHVLAALRAEPGMQQNRRVTVPSARAKSTAKPATATRPRSTAKPASRTPAQPPPGSARRRAPLGQPPPGPTRRRPPTSSAPKRQPSH